MKKIILFAIFLICACVVKAQNPTGVPQLFNGKWYKFNQFLGVDSALLVNNKDTNWLPRQPALVFWQNAASDTSFWVYNGKKWNKVGVVLDTTSLSNRINLRVKYSDTASMLSPYLRKLDTTSLSNRINLKADKATTLTINSVTYDLSANRTWTIPTTDTTSLSNRINLKLNISDTAAMLSPYQIAINARVKYTDTASMLAPYLRKLDTASLSNRINLKQNILSLTTTGTSGAATLVGATLNIPQYQGVLTNPITGTGTINTVAKFTSASAIGNSNIKDDGNAVTVNATAGSFGALQVGSYNGNILMNTTNSAAGLIFQNTSSSNKLWDISSYNNDLNFNESNIAPSRVILKAGGDVIVSNLAGSGTRMVVANASGVLSSQAIIDTTSLSNRINTKLNISDTAAMLSPYLKSAVTSVGLSMPNAFNVANSPITSTGTIAVTGAGTAAQYIRGDGVLATYNPGSGGGGSSQVFYFNGGVASGVAGYQEMSKVANTGASADFSINADGYIASFLTGAGVPNQVSIPAGNWNFEIYMSSNSAGGSPSFYVELYKYDGTTFTLISSSSANPEYITNGTAVDLYVTTLSVPTTTLLSTDRLAVRVYVTHSSKTITMHTQNGNLSEVITTFTTGLSSLNGLIANTQYFSTGTSGSDFNISSVTDTHTFNLPTASSTKRGALSSTDWSTFNGKMNYSDTVSLSNRINAKQNTLTLTTTGSSGAATLTGATLNIPNYGSALSGYVPYTGATGPVNLGAYDLTVNTLTIGRGGGAIYNNTAIGISALNSNTTGNFNTATGNGALSSNTTANYNTANGYSSLTNATTGGYNTANGAFTLSNNTIGFENTAFGYNTLGSNTSGNYNTGNGFFSLYSNTTGNLNTAFGHFSGYGSGVNANTTGSNNIFIGYNSVGVSSTESNRTWIGNSSTTSTWLAGNVLIGSTTNAGYKLDVNGTSRVTGVATFGSTLSNGTYTYTLPSATGTLALTSEIPTVSGTTNYISKFTGSTTLGISLLQDDGLGTLSYNAPSSYNANLTLNSLTSSASIVTFSQNGTKYFQTGSDATGNYRINSYTGATYNGVALYVPTGTSRVLLGNNTIDNGTSSLQVAGGSYFNGTTQTTGVATFNSTLSNGTYTYTLPSASGTLALVGGSGVGTVTSVATGLGLSGGTITTSGTLLVDTASASILSRQRAANTYYLASNPNGYTSNTGTVTSVATGLGLSGGTISTSGTLLVDTSSASILSRQRAAATYQAAGTYVTSVTGTSPIVSSGGTTPAISIPAASSSVNGYLSSTDWTTFNGKESALTFSSPLVRTTNAISIPVATTSVNGYLSATDWTTFNGKQNALTNPTTGTGTANYHAKFTGSTTLGNSLIWDNGTNVGIGNTNTSYTLDVTGTGRFSGQLTAGSIGQLAIFGTSNTSDKYITLSNSLGALYLGTNSTGNYIEADNTNPLKFIVNTSTTALTIASTGAATFSSSVECVKRAYVTGISTNAAYTTYTSTGANTAYFGVDNSAGNEFISGGSAYAVNLIGVNAYPMILGTNNAERMRITSGGNVGIGTTSPSHLLTLNNSGSGGTYLDLFQTYVDGNDWRNWTIGTNNQAFGDFNIIQSNATGGNPTSVGTSRLYISKVGNVGIGTTTDAGYKLDVNGTGRFTDALGGTSATFSGNAYFATSSGNVGIGTTSVSQPSAGATTLRILGTATTKAGAIVLESSDASVSTYIYPDNTNGLSINTSTSHPITFRTAGTTRLTIASTGAATFSSSVTATAFTAGGAGSGGAGTLTVRNDGGIPASIANEAVSGTLIRFSGNGSGVLGSISHNGTTTSYNITSDYRLKEDFKEYDGLSLINKIKTYDYQWKIDKTRMYGVVAHELQEVIPYAVQGVKDGTEMQSVDYSKLVPIMIKAIQEQQAQIKELQTEIQTLKNK